MTPTTKTGRLAVLALLLASIPLAGCSSSGPVAGAPAPGPGMVQFTSSDGFLTINVPADWEECTEEADDVFDTMGTMEAPGMRVAAAWDLDGGAFYGGASVIIIAHPAEGATMGELEEVAEIAWGALQDVFAGAAFSRQADVITADGHTLLRMDMVLSVAGATMEQVSLISIVDDVGIEIAVTVTDATLGEKDDAIEALETMVFD